MDYKEPGFVYLVSRAMFDDLCGIKSVKVKGKNKRSSNTNTYTTDPVICSYVKKVFGLICDVKAVVCK